jgi:hypothetical protein
LVPAKPKTAFLLKGIFSALLAACVGSSGAESEKGTVQNPSPEPEIECQVAEDCVLAASTCCECPTFGAPTASRFEDGCEDVRCEQQTDCGNVEAACDVGRCVMRCAAVIADRSCAEGFVRDAAGCLMNECDDFDGNGVDAECVFAQDCTIVPADCCGCARGGNDMAIPVSEAASYLGAMACDDDATCPEIDVCEAVVAECVAGECKLVADSPTPEPGEDDALCGSTELPACPAGQVCVLNDPDSSEAAIQGLGVCRPE